MLILLIYYYRYY